MFLVGLTGGIGTGKSTASDILQKMGVPIVDCDLIARQIVEPGRPAWKKIKVNTIRIFVTNLLIVLFIFYLILI